MKKNGFVAALLNFIAPGAGYLYAGYSKRAIIAFFVFVAMFPVVYAVAYHFPNIYFTILSFIIIIGLYIGIIFDVVRLCRVGKCVERRYGKWYFVLLYVVIFLVVRAVVVNILPYKIFTIQSTSMSDTLIPGDEVVIKEHNGYSPHRGEIVAFRYPLNPKVYYIKRCVAKEGDLLFVHNKDLYLHLAEGNEFMRRELNGFNMISIENTLWVKNPYMKIASTIHHDPSVTQQGNFPQAIFTFGPLQVPKGKVFVMGDNRDHSNDSRFWGFVDIKDIISPVRSIFVNFEYFNRSGLMVR